MDRTGDYESLHVQVSTSQDAMFCRMIASPQSRGQLTAKAWEGTEMRMPSSAAARVVVLAIGLALLFVVAPEPRPTRACCTATWTVYPGLPNSSIADYGWHYDELAGPQWGARDYSYAGDAGANVVLSVKLTQTSTYSLRWRFDSTSASCTVKATAQAFVFNTWVDVAGTEMHFIHLSDRVANGTTTSTVKNSGSTVFVYLGHVDLRGTQEHHSHESASASSGTRMFAVHYTDDTCWSDNAATYTYQCSGGLVYRAHTNGTGCPPGAWNGGYWTYSGTITQYANCDGLQHGEEWSYEPRNYTLAAFLGQWS